MKQQDIKKRLFMESMGLLGGLAVGAALLFFLVSIHDETEAENRSLQTKVVELDNQMASLNDKFIKLQKNHEVYEEAKQKNQNEQLIAIPETVAPLLKQIRAKYNLKCSPFGISESFDIENAAYKKTTAVIKYYTATLACDALTDEDVYKVIAAIQRDFTGAVKITNLTLDRKLAVENDVLLDIAKNGHQGMVTFELKFDWFGIFPVELPDTAGKPNAG